MRPARSHENVSGPGPRLKSEENAEPGMGSPACRALYADRTVRNIEAVFCRSAGPDPGLVRSPRIALP